MSWPLILREGDPARPVALTRGEADALAASARCTVVPTGEDGWWNVTPGVHVGVVNVGGRQVVIQPKVSINRLLFLLGYARNPEFWTSEPVHLDAEAELPEALAAAFLTLATRALDQGVLKGYREVEETLAVLRGRIREADQLRRRWGRLLPLEVRYDDFTVDIAENQLLLACSERLLRMPGVAVRHRQALQRLRLLLADVSQLTRGSALPTWTPSRLNARYAPALRLAELILAGWSFEQRGGSLTVTGYLVNMASVFEDFVTAALGRALRRHGGRVQCQFRTSLDVGGVIPVRPDLVWLERGRPIAVVDAKYKAEKPSGFPQADLYQLVAYATVLGLDVGHLVYAKGNEDAQVHEIRNADLTVVAHTLDLQAERSDLLASVDVLAAKVSAMAAGRSGESARPVTS